jgi:SAM-dependent methyltransferase
VNRRPDDLHQDLLTYAYASEAGVKRWHITRVKMYSVLADRLASLDGPDKRCLCISHSRRLARIVGLQQAELHEAAYPAVDLRKLVFPDETFDFLVADQVLEHVEGDPFQALAETVRVLRPGGQAVHTTCFVNAVHGGGLDYWRFTPKALRLLAETAGADVLLCDGWGNRAALDLIHRGFRMRPIPEEPGNPIYQLAMRNEEDFPIVTWVVLQKPARAAGSRNRLPRPRLHQRRRVARGTTPSG